MKATQALCQFGLATADAFASTGLSKREVALIESGERELALRELHSLGRFLGVQPSTLVQRAELVIGEMTASDVENRLRPLHRALTHDLRALILGALLAAARQTTEAAPRNAATLSPLQLSKALGERLGNVSYHVRRLDHFGIIELVHAIPRRGAIEHRYAIASEWYVAVALAVPPLRPPSDTAS